MMLKPLKYTGLLAGPDIFYDSEVVPATGTKEFYHGSEEITYNLGK